MFLKINDLTIHYEKNGSGPALLMVHGNGESISIFNKSISLLKKYFTVYAIDLPGHGKSESPSDFHYKDMSSYVYDFITMLGLENLTFYGFSDGAIIGLILASEHQHIFSRMIISGANLNPGALKKRVRIAMLLEYITSSDPRILMMLKEPYITVKDLKKIVIPVYITAGQNDVIPLSHSEEIKTAIRNSELRIFTGHTHGSYIINSDEIGQYIINVCS